MGSEIAPKQLFLCLAPVHCQVATKSLGSFVHLIAYLKNMALFILQNVSVTMTLGLYQYCY